VITGYIEREALAVAGLQDGVLGAGRAGEVRPRRQGSVASARPATRRGPSARYGIVPVRPELVAAVRYFGRYRTGRIRDGVLLSVS
jgi:hypothetical protein